MSLLELEQHQHKNNKVVRSLICTLRIKGREKNKIIFYVTVKNDFIFF